MRDFWDVNAQRLKNFFQSLCKEVLSLFEMQSVCDVKKKLVNHKFQGITPLIQENKQVCCRVEIRANLL